METRSRGEGGEGHVDKKMNARNTNWKMGRKERKMLNQPVKSIKGANDRKNETEQEKLFPKVILKVTNIVVVNATT